MIACIGDSITYGQGVEFEESWPILIGGKNLGVCGETTRHGLNRFRAVQGASTVIIQFGHNDANRWDTDMGLRRVSLAAYTANLWEMVSRSKKYGAERVIIGIPYLTQHKGAQYREDVRAYAAVAVIVARLRGCKMWRAKCDLLPDGIHPSVDGHKQLAEQVGRLL